MHYDVVTYGDPVLREKACLVNEVTDEIRQLVTDMLKTMNDYNGLGLAAQQIGRTESVCVIDCSPLTGKDDKPVVDENPTVAMPLIMVNPRITDSEGTRSSEEGCLSFPEIYVSVERAVGVTVVFLDLDNEEQTITATGLLARAIQHELDHLSGVLLFDHMSSVRKIALRGKLKRLKQKKP